MATPTETDGDDAQPPGPEPGAPGRRGGERVTFVDGERGPGAASAATREGDEEGAISPERGRRRRRGAAEPVGAQRRQRRRDGYAGGGNDGVKAKGRGDRGDTGAF